MEVERQIDRKKIDRYKRDRQTDKKRETERVRKIDRLREEEYEVRACAHVNYKS